MPVVVRPVEAMEEELVVGAGGFNLLLPGTREDGAVTAGRGAVEDGDGGAGCRKEEEGAVLACRGVKVLLPPTLPLLLLDWRPCNSFSANMAR